MFSVQFLEIILSLCQYFGIWYHNHVFDFLAIYIL